MESIILEIRAGTGGQEAALFAADLLRMYKRFAESQNWKFKEEKISQSDLGGIKEVAIRVSGADAFQKLKFESGVHRIQRIPKTEKSGRIHTSTATVAVLPELPITDYRLPITDLKIESFRSSGPGGQHMQKTSSAVRITHIPTGISAVSQEFRHQLQNKARAMEILKEKLKNLETETLRNKLDKTRKEQIGTGERSEKIRTYNFPQNRVTDQRVGKSWHNLDKILDGKLEPVISALLKI